MNVKFQAINPTDFLSLETKVDSEECEAIKNDPDEMIKKVQEGSQDSTIEYKVHFVTQYLSENREIRQASF